jgi:hypothetical protein
MTVRWAIRSVAAVIALIVILGVLYHILTDGIRVVVRNEGPGAMRDVAVFVTGRTYYLNDIPPGQERSVRVRPKGESHIEIGYIDEAGRSVRLDAGGYFESGYHGTVRVGISGGRVESFQQNVDPLFAW